MQDSTPSDVASELQPEGLPCVAQCCVPRIAVCAAVSRPQVPRALTQQLAPGGRLVMPVGAHGASQELMVIDKTQDGKHFNTYSAMGVV